MSKSPSSQYLTSKSDLAIAASVTEEEFLKPGYFFPSDDIEPSLKKGKWCLAWQKAIWSLFIRKGAYTNVDMLNEIRWLRQYGAGVQPKQLYIDRFLNENRETYINTNWEIFSPVSKYKRIVFGRFEDQDFEYSANAIDPISKTEKDDMFWDIWFDSNYGDHEKYLRQILGIPEKKDVKYYAKSLEELEMVRQMGGIKSGVEQYGEALLDATDFVSNKNTIARKVWNDLFDLNKAAIRDLYDPQTGLCKFEWVDWENLIVDYSRETDFKDIRFWGYLKFCTINEIRVKRPDLTEDEIIKAAIPWMGYYGNINQDLYGKYQQASYKDENKNYVFNNLRVPVFVSEWMSTDTRYETFKNGKYYPQTGKDYGKIKNTDKKKTKTFTANNIYSSEWIVGSNIIMEDGIALNVSRKDKREPKFSLHAIALPGKSIIDTIIPNLDQIQLTKLKLENALSLAKPLGLKIEVGTLENIDLGDGELAPKEIIKIARETGDVLYKATTHAGQWNNSTSNPIDISQGGIGNFLDECIKLFELNFNFISELSGISRLSAASPTTEAETATASKIATAATNDALKPLFTSYIMLKEWAGQKILPRIQNSLKKHPLAKEAYKGLIGEMGVKIMDFTEQIGVANIGIKVQILPNAQQKQDARMAATEALKPGKDGENINFADWLYIVDCIDRGRIKQAKYILEYRLNLSREQSLKLQKENMEEARKTGTAQEEAKTRRELTIIKAKEKAEIRVEAAKALMTMKLSDHDALNEIKKNLIMEVLASEAEAQPEETQEPAMQ